MINNETDKIKKAIFGGGCFWCTEAVFQNLKGVSLVESGFSGGHIKNPPYREVCTGITGHAEVIQITYDPKIISFSELAIIHLTTHDPTTLNRQGADIGTHYRSIIFHSEESEKIAAQEAIEKVQPSFSNPIVTELKEFEVFYMAEKYHQDYYNNNSSKAYCQAVINPKLAKFRALYSDRMKTP